MTAGDVTVRPAVSGPERAACYAVRHEVFVLGQGVPADLERDEHDEAGAAHFLAVDAGGRPVGAARFVDHGGAAKIGRVAVVAAWRGRGVGSLLMRAAADEARRRGYAEAVLGSQVSAIPFYEKLGYVAEGGEFLDAGIRHRLMRLKLQARAPREGVLMAEVYVTLVGGPTLLIEFMGLRLLTDPTFDPAGSEYALGPVTLRKTAGPAVPAAGLGPIDAVLLTHDQHPDNLDAAGRELLPAAGRVRTTPAGAGRLGGNAVGLEPWQTFDLPAAAGAVRVTATPARHGPAGCEPVSGDVTGFHLAPADGTGPGVYVSGDTVWYEGVAEAARRLPAAAAVLFLGAATVPEVGPDHLTMTAAEAVEAARAFAGAAVVPAHCDGWAHFREGREAAERAFAKAGLSGRLRLPRPGVRTLVGD